MSAHLRRMAALAAVLVVPAPLAAADEPLSGAEITRRGKPATALVEVKPPSNHVFYGGDQLFCGIL